MRCCKLEAESVDGKLAELTCASKVPPPQLRGEFQNLFCVAENTRKVFDLAKNDIILINRLLGTTLQ